MRSKPLILISLLLAAFVINLDTTMVNVALPSLVRELHATTSQLQWIVDAFNLVFAALLLTAGSLSDRLGRKGMLMAGLAVFGAASMAGGFTTSPSALIAARAVMGLGAAMSFPPTLSLISNVFTERGERARAIGLWGATAGIAVSLGPIVGGWLLEHFRWGSIFFAIGPVAAATVIMVALSIPTSKDPEAGRIDLAGLSLSAAAMALVVFTVIEAPTYAWNSPRTITGLLASAVLFAVFVLWERRVQNPMLDVRIFRNMRFSAASGSVTISFFALFGFTFLVVQYFQFLHGYSPLSTGVRLLPVAISIAVGSVAGTQLAVKFGTKLVVTTGLLLVTTFYFWVAGAETATTSYTIIAAQMVILGFGMGITSAPATESIMGAVSNAKAGVGSAVNDSTRLLGGTLGVAVLGSVYASLYSARLTHDLPASLPRSLSAATHQSLGAAFAVASKISSAGHPRTGSAIHQITSDAFLHGFSAACLVAGGVAAAGVIFAAVFIPAQPLVLNDGHDEVPSEPLPASTVSSAASISSITVAQ